MKKLMTLATLVLLSGLYAQATQWSVTLTTTNQVVAPALRGYTAVPATNLVSYSAGDYVLMPNGRNYWTPNGGFYIEPEAPTHRSGMVTAGTGIKWLAIRSSRNNITIQLTQSGDVWFNDGTDDAVNGGSRLLTGKGMAWVFDNNYAGELNALAGSGTKVITISEK